MPKDVSKLVDTQQRWCDVSFMFYVNEKSAAVAREYEKRLQALPASAGIIFVSVAAIPVEGGNTIFFDVSLGITKDFDPSLGVSLVKSVFDDEVSSGAAFFRTVSSIVGVSGAAHDRGNQGDARPRQDEA